MSRFSPSIDDFPYFGDGIPVSKRFDTNYLKPGCAKPDCIPSIDNPKWLNSSEITNLWENEVEILVLLIPKNNKIVESYAVPITMLDVHEIVNFESIDGTPIALTYCPLCKTATGYNRTVDGEVVELGVSGLLLNSAVVFFDRNTNSLFSQVWSEGIVGKYVGQKLKQLPIIQTSIREVLEIYPDCKIISPETGMERQMKSYGKNVYQAYHEDSRIRFPVAIKMDNPPPKQLGFVIELEHTTFYAKEKLTGEQELKGCYTTPHAGGRLFFKGKLNQEINWSNWIPSGISYYFVAKNYFPDCEYF